MLHRFAVWAGRNVFLSAVEASDLRVRAFLASDATAVAVVLVGLVGASTVLALCLVSTAGLPAVAKSKAIWALVRGAGGDKWSCTLYSSMNRDAFASGTLFLLSAYSNHNRGVGSVLTLVCTSQPTWEVS